MNKIALSHWNNKTDLYSSGSKHLSEDKQRVVVVAIYDEDFTNPVLVRETNQFQVLNFGSTLEIEDFNLNDNVNYGVFLISERLYTSDLLRMIKYEEL